MLSSAAHQPNLLRHRQTIRIPTVCVVDSQVAEYEGWETTAEAIGARLHFMASAADALRYSRTNSVDLWVVNAELPGVSGCDLCGMLKAQNSRATVFMVANEYSVSTERLAWASGATLFGVKPDHESWLLKWREALRARRPIPGMKPV